MTEPPSSKLSAPPRSHGRALVAFDKLKGAMDAEAACAIAAAVLQRRMPGWDVDVAPLTDGGDGFCRILTGAVPGARIERVAAAGPIFDGSAPRERAEGTIGWVELQSVPPAARELLALPSSVPERLAVIDLASVNGLARLAPRERDVWHASTFGAGELIRAAVARGARAVLLGVGGSATNDLGLGALSALGLRFEDMAGSAVHPVPASWSRIARIGGDRLLEGVALRIACDVSNPLLGPRGAAAVFGPQKGLSHADVPRMDAAAAHMATLVVHALQVDFELTARPGAGAAGGVAFGLMAAAGARIVPGFELVSAWCDLDRRLAAADLVITGEGRFDASSWSGKGPGALLERAQEQGRRCVAFAGSVDSSAVRPGAPVVAITPPGQPLDQALNDAASNLERALERWLCERSPNAAVHS